MNDRPTGVEARVCEDIAARQRVGIAKYGRTPEVDEFVANHDFQPTVPDCLNFAVSLERQRDAYAETLREIAAMDPDWTVIIERHPELANARAMASGAPESPLK